MGESLVNRIDEKGKRSLASRLITALVLALVFIPCIVLGGYFWFIAMAAILLVAIKEFISVTKKKYKWYIYLVCYLSTLVFTYWAIIKANGAAHNEMGDVFVFSLSAYCDGISVSIWAAVLSLFFFFFVAIMHDDFDLHDVVYLFAMCFFVGVGFQSMYFLRYYPTYLAGLDTIYWPETSIGQPGFEYFQSWLLIGFVVGVSLLNDAWAYFVGILFGKHHINPRISPKKTYEGFFGGWFLTTASCFGIAALLDSCGSAVIPGLLDMDNWYWVLLLSFAIPGFGNLGDFSFSLIKRTYGTKDFGWILKGHGGILDRVDSVLFSCLGAALLIVFIKGGWNFFA